MSFNAKSCQLRTANQCLFSSRQHLLPHNFKAMEDTGSHNITTR